MKLVITLIFLFSFIAIAKLQLQLHFTTKFVCNGENGLINYNGTVDCGNDSVIIDDEKMSVIVKVRADVCLREKNGRGVGVSVGHNCIEGYGLRGENCYQNCKEGFESTQSDPQICRKIGCGPNPAFEESAHRGRCMKPPKYDRGKGYPRKITEFFKDEGMMARCEADHGAGNCEKFGSSAYPKCMKHYHSVGCCTCEPTCPDKYEDVGTYCLKETYQRDNTSTYYGCSPGKEQSSGVCYNICEEGFIGVNSICWKKCPQTYPINCGIFCAKDREQCNAAANTLNNVKGLTNAAVFDDVGHPFVTSNGKIIESKGAIITTASVKGFTIAYELEYEGNCLVIDS